MKKIFAFLLVVSLLLCGCGKDPNVGETTVSSSPETTKTSAESTAPTKKTVLEVPEIPMPEGLRQTEEMPNTLKEWVSVSYNETFTWKEKTGNLCSVSVTLPELPPITEFAVEFNREIYEYGTLILDEIRSCIQGQSWIDIYAVSYEAYLNDNILSILIVERTNIDLIYFTAYSFDIQAQKALTTSDLCRRLLDMSYPAFLIAGNQIIANEFISRYSEYVNIDSKVLSDEQKIELAHYESILEGIPTLNAAARNLYVGEDGTVMFVYNAPSMAGAFYYPQAAEFDLRQVDWDYIPSDAEAYGWLFDMRYNVDGAYADSYCSILVKAFLEDPESFVEQASKLSNSSLELIAGFIIYGLDKEEYEQFEEICDSLSNKNLTQAEKNVVKELLTAFTE